MQRQFWLAVTLCLGSEACSADKDKGRAVDAGATGGSSGSSRDAAGDTASGSDAGGLTDGLDAGGLTDGRDAGGLTDGRDASGPDDGGGTGADGNGGARGAHEGGILAPDAADLCVPVDVSATRATPEILVLMDKSGSMVWAGCAAAGDPIAVGCPTPTAPYDQPFDRWAPSVAALKSTTRAFEDSVRFGLMVFPSPALPGPLPPITQEGCQPGRVSVEPALNTADAIAVVLDSEMADGESTPIPGSLRTAHEALGVATTQSTAVSKYVLLITDGEPNCRVDRQSAATVEDAAADAYSELDALRNDGIRTYVIGYDTDIKPETAAVMDEMARRGGTGEVKHRLVSDEISLHAAINAVLDRAGQCTFELDKAVADPDHLRVTLDGKLREEGVDGWSLTHGKALELRGQACEEIGNLTIKHSLKVQVDCDD